MRIVNAFLRARWISPLSAVGATMRGSEALVWEARGGDIRGSGYLYDATGWSLTRRGQRGGQRIPESGVVALLLYAFASGAVSAFGGPRRRGRHGGALRRLSCKILTLREQLGRGGLYRV